MFTVVRDRSRSRFLITLHRLTRQSGTKDAGRPRLRTEIALGVGFRSLFCLRFFLYHVGYICVLIAYISLAFLRLLFSFAVLCVLRFGIALLSNREVLKMTRLIPMTTIPTLKSTGGAVNQLRDRCYVVLRLRTDAC